MFEVSDVVVAGVLCIAFSLFSYSSIKKTLNSRNIALEEKLKPEEQKLAQKELWEHAAYVSASGIALFLLLLLVPLRLCLISHFGLGTLLRLCSFLLYFFHCVQRYAICSGTIEII